MPETVSKTISRTTHLAYVRRLNKLAGAGFDSSEKLLEKPTEAVSAIKKLSPGSDNEARNERRYYISAVFYVLPKEYRESPNPFSKLNNVSRPVDLPSGKKWDNNKERYLANNA
jgi:hypothetical protein